MSLISDIEAEAGKLLGGAAEAAAPDAARLAAEAVDAAAPVAKRIFDHATVDIRTELPALMAKLGVNTSDEGSVLHATLVLVVDLLAAYGPAEVRAVLAAA